MKLKRLIIVPFIVALSGCSVLSSEPINSDAPQNYYRSNGPAHSFKDFCNSAQPVYENPGSAQPGTACVTLTTDFICANTVRDGQPKDPYFWPKNQKVIIPTNKGTSYRWAYDRSHLIADSLGGDNDPDNIIAGTRTQNVGLNDSSNPGGMAYTETLVRDYLSEGTYDAKGKRCIYPQQGEHRDATVTYQVTPHYEKNEKIPRTVEIDMKSSDGSIDENVTVFNSIEGYSLDYTTGKLLQSKDTL